MHGRRRGLTWTAGVLPGNYNVSLVVDGQVAGTKPMSVLIDPVNPLTEPSAAATSTSRWSCTGCTAAAPTSRRALTPLHTQMTEIAGKIDGMANVSEAVKTQFIAMQKEFDTVRVKFGVPRRRPMPAADAAVVAAAVDAAAAPPPTRRTSWRGPRP